MRVMLDTNIIISAALFPNGRTAQAFNKALVPPYQPIVCDYVIDELQRKFREKFPQRTTELESFLFKALAHIKLVSTLEDERPSRKLCKGGQRWQYFESKETATTPP